MILAAGRGTRLGSLGRRVPKALVPVGGRPLLARHLESLEREGIERVVVNAHHLADQVSEFLGAYTGPLEVVCIIEPQLFGTAGSVRRALAHLAPGPFLVVYGDVLVNDPLGPLLEAHRRQRGVATIGVHEATSAEGKGVVEVDANGQVTRFVEKGAASEGHVLINSGVYVVEAALVASLPVDVTLDFGHEVFPTAVDRGDRIVAHRFAHAVIDVGTAAGLALARREAEART